jgi:sulfonate transport system substrate-binding protein
MELISQRRDFPIKIRTYAKTLSNLFLLPQRSNKSLRTLLVASSWLSLAIFGCVPSNSANTNTAQNVSNQTQEKTSLIRLGYQKGGVVPIARQRGELEKRLTAQNIKVEWAGPFDRCATLLQAISANQADIGGCGDIPGLSAIAAGQELCIGAVQRPRPESFGFSPYPTRLNNLFFGNLLEDV